VLQISDFQGATFVRCRTQGKVARLRGFNVGRDVILHMLHSPFQTNK
jgi:hypothetical protein